MSARIIFKKVIAVAANVATSLFFVLLTHTALAVQTASTPQSSPLAIPSQGEREEAASFPEARETRQLWIYNLNALPTHQALYRLKQAIEQNFFVKWDNNVIQPNIETLKIVCARRCSPETCKAKDFLGTGLIRDKDFNSSSKESAPQYIQGISCMTFCYRFGREVIEGCQRETNKAINQSMKEAQKMIDSPQSPLPSSVKKKTQTLINKRPKGYHEQLYNSFVSQMIAQDSQDPSYKTANKSPPPPPHPFDGFDSDDEKYKEDYGDKGFEREYYDRPYEGAYDRRYEERYRRGNFRRNFRRN